MKALWACAQAFTPEECEWIIQTVQKETPTWAYTGRSPDLKKVFEHRRSKVFWIKSDHPTLGFIHERYWRNVSYINNNYFKAHITDLPPLQLTQYSEQYQGEYKIHMDLDWIEGNSLSSEPGQQRKISAIVQLSDPNSYEGGDFEFDQIPEYPPKDVVRKQGVMTCFPSFVLHGVKPVTKGKRYSIVGWFEGPPWR
jgi:PKHD-type hydroxylase